MCIGSISPPATNPMAEPMGLSWQSLRAVALVLLAVKLALLVLAHPFMDETYYFMWGQHPALSYFDHPSLVGWAEGVSGALFGWTIFGLRLPVLLTLIGDIFLLDLLSRHRGEQWRGWFWGSVVLLCATPILFGLTSVALPDHLLVFFSLAAVYAVERWQADSKAPRWLYLAGLAIGLATLSKYTGALLGAGLVLYIVTTPGLRPALRSPHLYLAALVAIALQAPVLIWNAQHGWASFGFIVGGRHGVASPASFSGVSGYLLGALVVLAPFILVPMFRFAFGRDETQGFARIVFWLSSLAFLVASLFANILIHWNVVAYVAVLPYLAGSWRSRWLAVAQIGYGALAIVLAAVNYTVAPLTAFTSHADQTSGWSYGWDEVAAAVRGAEAGETVGFVAATDYALASPLGFALADADVTSLSARHDAYDDWFDPASHKGESAIIVADQWRPIDSSLAAQFGEVDTVKSLDIVRFGKPIDHYTIYLARNFSPG